MSDQTHNPVKVWVDPDGYIISALDRVMKEDPTVTRVLDIKEADVGYVDSEVQHWEDYYYDYDQFYSPLEQVPQNSMGLWCPFYTKGGSKKRAAIMFRFADKMFPGTYTIHPLTFPYPEKRDDLIAYMKENKDTHFIAKPDDGVCGQDILLIHTIEDLDGLNKDTEYAIQKYVNDPLLYGKRQRKIDFRVSFTQVTRNGETFVYFSKRHQGRVAPDTYIPLSGGNKDSISTHLTCYQDLFDPGHPKYFPTIDDSTWNDYNNFQAWKNIVKYYEEETSYENFAERAHDVFRDFALQTHSILTPFYKFFYEIWSADWAARHNYTFFNLWGMDALLSDKMEPFWLENNLTPSNGDINESQGLPTPANPAFVEFGKDAVSLWIDAARNKDNFEHKPTLGCWEQIAGPCRKDPFEEQSKTLAKLFDLYILLTTGKAELAPIDISKPRDPTQLRFPVTISKEQILKLADYCPRVTAEELSAVYATFGGQEKHDIYLLTMIINEVFTRDEILAIFERIAC